MIFGAMAAWQAWLLLAAAAAAATGLFLLKTRPPRIVVSSLTLWRRVLDQPRPMTLWERIRRAVSLLVAVLTTLALALAIVRPSFRASTPTGSSPSGRVLLVIDSSWSMLAQTASGETRWDRAVRTARTLALAGAAGGDQVALATTADGLVEEPTSDAALLEAALDRIAPSGGEASAWPHVAGARAVHFMTDGAVARRVDPAVTVHSVFEPAANVAITAFEVRPAQQANLAGEAYLEVANYAAAPQQVRVALTRGNVPVFDRQVEMAAGEAIREVVPLSRDGDARLRAHIEAPHNALVADDEAVAWIVRAQPVTVTVVSEQPAPFGLLLERDPDVRARLVRPSEYRPGNEDVVIFDRWLPPEAPSRPALCFAPPASAWLGDPGVEERAPRWTAAGSHPVLRGVDPLTLTIARARAYGAPDLVPLARSEHGTPLVYAAETPARRLVLVTFSARESNLAFAPGFPVLVGNAIEWLARPESGGTRRPGVALFAASVSRVVAPSGKAVALTRVGDAAVGLLGGPGLYVAESAGARTVVAVNIGDPEESNLTRTSLSAAEPADAAPSRASPRAWWLYCLSAAIALLAGEWWTWQRRITV